MNTRQEHSDKKMKVVKLQVTMGILNDVPMGGRDLAKIIKGAIEDYKDEIDEAIFDEISFKIGANPCPINEDIIQQMNVEVID